MEKLIFGFDLGVNSVGWAATRTYDEGAVILGMGSRIVPSDPKFHGKYYSGNTASKNADRRIARGARRGNQRFKQRRNQLCTILKNEGMYDDELTHLTKMSLYGLRARAASERIEMKQLGRVWRHMIQRRGFKSNRKAMSEEENSTDYKKRIAELTTDLQGRTIGQALYHELSQSGYQRVRGRTYLRQDYIHEFNTIWETQQQYHPQLTGGPDDRRYDSLYWQVANETLYFQRPLKSAKGLVGKCIFETHLRVCPVSSPYYQAFVLYQKLNDVEMTFLQTRQKRKLTSEERNLILKALHQHKSVDRSNKLSQAKIVKLLGFKRDQVQINFDALQGNKTYNILYKTLEEAGVEDIEQCLLWDETAQEQDLMSYPNLYSLWHVLYSVEDEGALIRILQDKYGFSPDQAQYISQKVGFKPDFGKLSTKAIKNLLQYMRQGKQYSVACDAAGYDHSGYKSDITLQDTLPLIPPNALRNPVVEQILNQLTNVTNTMIQTYGHPDEIRVEMARELKSNAKQRAKARTMMSQNKKRNDNIRTSLTDEYDMKIVNGRDVARYKLWEETDRHCLYCGKSISATEMRNGQADIEHIIPRSRSFNDSLQNKIITHVPCNRAKNQDTAYDYVSSLGADRLHHYTLQVNELFTRGGDSRISKAKYDNLMMTGADIPDDFVNRQSRDTSYIVVEAVKHLRKVCAKVNTTTGTVTDFLREDWRLKDLLKELTLPKYKKAGKVETKTIKTSDGQTKDITIPTNWSKRDDQRHHAIDALITAFTNQKIIFHLNNRNKIYQYRNEQMSPQEVEDLKATYQEQTGEEFKLHSFTQSAKRDGFKVPPPIPDLREQVKIHLENMLISIKKTKSKAVSVKYNKIKGSTTLQRTLVPRGALHEETVRGQTQWYKKDVPLTARFDQVEAVADPILRQLLQARISHYGSIKEAFGKAALTKDPIRYRDEPVDRVVIFDQRFTKRVEVAALTDNQLTKIIDPTIKRRIAELVEEHGGKAKAALKNYPSNPLYLDAANTIPIWRVKVWDDGTYIALRQREVDGRSIPNDFVTPGNNHHALIYRDEEGRYSSRLVSLYDAVNLARILMDEEGKPTSVIDRNPHPETGAPFYMSLQINDLVLLDVTEEVLSGGQQYDQQKILADRLFRVQKMTLGSKSLDIFFRHHLESSVENSEKELRNITWERIQSDKHLGRLTKIKVNHLGHIIKLHHD